MKDPLPPVRPFERAQMAHLPRQQRPIGPDGAAEHGGGVRGGGHRIEDRVPPLRIDILRLVADEQQGGGLAAHIRLRPRREEARRRPAQAHDVARLRCRARREAARQVVVQAIEEPGTGDQTLRAIGRRGDDDRAARAPVRRQQIGQQLR